MLLNPDGVNSFSGRKIHSLCFLESVRSSAWTIFSIETRVYAPEQISLAQQI